MDRVENAEWFKSSHSNGNGECVEVAYLDDMVVTRDSKVQAGPVLSSTLDGWKTFIGSVAEGAL
ncbi:MULTISPECIES: DUF397 domain-containing protein [unclassified Streptomyces]|uniref:DUF397 domain-containing protein n=1 Tax=unclassified Streptomyces TaxID=2593676 RepID=UPI001660DC23|nr:MULTISPECIES: DUF397 domain-containing protein [unclassified Streptomyces]MBD0707247.1 DUF397 domain-containing protein [Streptomyces sp. CBMA291]MBD0713735.1 DUF397 domain-containing protein [Streptomyces sp. CBMA370]